MGKSGGKPWLVADRAGETVRAGPPLSRGKISSKPLALSTRKPCCALGAAGPGPVASSLRQGYWAARGAARGAQQRGAPLIQNRPSCNSKRAQRWWVHSASTHSLDVFSSHTSPCRTGS